MDIYGAEAHIKKVNLYLEDILNSDPYMYSKTKKRLVDLSSELVKGIDIISKILEDDMMLDESEFSDIPDSDMIYMEEMKSNLATLNSRIVPVTSTESKNSKELVELSSNKKKFIVARYRSVLLSLAQENSKYPDVSDCASTLWKWFDSRFFLSRPVDPTFKYKLEHLPEWVEAIVFSYGYHLHNQTLDEFRHTFMCWIDSILTTGNRVPYSLPYEIYQLYSSNNPETVTTEAIALWDALFDLGLNKLTIRDLESVKLNPESMYTHCSNLNSQLTDSYTYYENDDSCFTMRGDMD